ncbi:hypothetical protein ACEXQD_18680 [Herbiconiux sp. P15]
MDDRHAWLLGSSLTVEGTTTMGDRHAWLLGLPLAVEVGDRG